MTWGDARGGGTPGSDAEDDLLATAWRTHDENRLYVTTISGEPVGWVDLGSGARHLDRAELGDRFDVTVAMHVAMERSPYLPASDD